MKIDRRLLALLPGASGSFWVAVIAGLGVGLTAVAQARVLAYAIHRGFLKQCDWTALTPALALLLALALIRAVLTWVEPVASQRCAARIQQRLLRILLKAVGKKGPYHLRDHRSGELVELLTKGRESLTAWYAQYLPALLQAAILPLLTLFFVFPADLLTGFILLLTAPLIPMFTMLIGLRAHAMADKQWSLLERLSSGLLDRIQGLETLKNLNQAWAQAHQLEKEGQTFRWATMKVLKTAFLSAMALELVATLSTALVAVSIGIRLLHGSLSFEPALFVLILAPDFFRPLRRLGANFHASLEGTAAAEKIFSFTEDLSPKTCHRMGTGLLYPNPASPLLELRNLSFTHPKSGFGIEGLSLILHTHELVVLTGPSGSGKTTLFELILGFMEPTSGEICIKGQAFCAEQGEVWLSQIGWMSQRPHLFHESLAYNTALGQDHAKQDQIEQCVRKAGLGSLLEQLPNGLDTLVGEEGTRLSGGQAQRLALARVLQKACPLVLLDEPAAHLDPDSVKVLLRQLKVLKSSCGILVAAHNLELAREADRVVYLEKGHIVAEGTHVEVLKACPQYAAMMASQPGGRS